MDISNWPPLQAGECVQLPLLGTVYQTYIPSLTSANLQPLNPLQPNPFVEKVAPITSIPEKAIPRQKSSERSAKINDNNKNIPESPCASELTRENILDNYKQSKEILLRNASEGINDVDEIDDDDDDDDVDDACDDDSLGDLKINETTNTQCKSDAISTILPNVQQSTHTPVVLSSVHDIDIFRSLSIVLSYTHLLWELVLTAEPIVVMATSPSDCSHMVQSLMRYDQNVSFIDLNSITLPFFVHTV